MKMRLPINKKELVWLFLCLLLFFLLLYVVNHTQELVNSRDQEWMTYLRDCKCQCNNLDYPGNAGNFIPNNTQGYDNFTVNVSNLHR